VESSPEFQDILNKLSKIDPAGSIGESVFAILDCGLRIDGIAALYQL